MPTIASQTPSAGSAIRPTDPITIEVDGISGPFLLALVYPDGGTEYMWDGQVFAPFFLKGSSHDSISGGVQHFTLYRTGGWKVAPTIVLPLAGPGDAVPPTRTLTAGAGLTGGGDLSADRTFNVIANADGSILAHADDIQVGVLASDAQHGNRGGGGIHANAVSGGAAGFLSGPDKAAIDDLSSGTVTKANGATLVPAVGGGVINACTGAGAVTPAASSWIGKQVSIALDGVATCVITSADASDRFYTGSGAAATSYTCNGSSVLIYRGANKILAYP